MYILDEDIKQTISGIVSFFKRRSLTAKTVHDHFRLQQDYLNQLEGLNALFIGDAKIKILLDSAKMQINEYQFAPSPMFLMQAC